MSSKDGWLPTTRDGHRLRVQLRILVQRACPNAIDDAAFEDLLHNFTFAAIFVATLRMRRPDVAEWLRRLADNIDREEGTSPWVPPALPRLEGAVNRAALDELKEDDDETPRVH
jgi:hypothetical protein